MLKLLIVDDERTVREGLKSIIDWSEYGFQVCGEAENGVDGFEMIKKLNPDLVIADIRMPGMDGLEMVEECNRQGIASKIIILTGYSEFQYARQSIALGVKSYLLKPIDEEELIDQVVKISEGIKEERKTKNLLYDSMLHSKEKIIENLVIGQMDEQRINEANQLFLLGLPWKSYQVALIEINSDIQIDMNMKLRIKAEINEFIKENKNRFFFELEGKMGILLKDVPDEPSIQPIQAMYDIVQRRSNLEIIAAIGSKVSDIKHIRFSYEQAYHLLENKFIWGSKKIMVYNKETSISAVSQTINTIDFGDTVEKLYIAVDVNNKQNIRNLLQELGQVILNRKPKETTIKTYFTNIYITVMNQLAVSNKSLKKFDLSNEIYCTKDIEELICYVGDKLTAVSDELAMLKPDVPMEKIIDFIQRNYHQDIKIKSLAEIFNYNSTYLGQLFKSYTGKYFNTYLEHVRIEKAKQFLKEGLKVYEVAERIGYHNLDYFSSKFKKYVGVSPSEYKEDR